MKVFVTGGTGFLGSHVVEQLVAGGHEVVALVRKNSNRTFLSTLANVALVEGSVEDRASLDRGVAGVDAVVHSAGLVKARSEAAFFACNRQGTLNLLEAVREHAPKLQRFVHVSSLEACGPSFDRSPVPSEQEQPVTAYGRSKLDAEKAVLTCKDVFPVVVLRPAAIYGPRDVEFLEAFKAARKRQWPVIGNGEMLGCYTYAPDCARACIQAITADIPSGNIYFVDDGEPLAMARAMGDMLHEALGTSPLLRFGIPFPVLRMASLGVEAYGKVRNKPVMLTREKVAMLSHHWVCDSSKTKSDLNWSPEVRLGEGLRRTAQWYEEQGWL